MSNEERLPPITDDEWLARFIYYRRYIRQDWTVRPDAFVPYPYPDLSVTRHLQLSASQLWDIGHNVAREIGETLRGRASVQCLVFRQQALRVLTAPLPENPNHANVSGWPAEKPAQKIIAQEIAAAAGKAIAPP
jgi:hypothetical protein